MRRARSISGPGLAGIDTASLYRRKVWFARPLLGVRRAWLRRWLADQSLGYLDDPSNDDSRFERVRVRAQLSCDPGEHDLLIATARRHRAARLARAVRGAPCVDDRRTWRCPAGAVAFDPDQGRRCHDADGLRAAMAGVLTQVGRLPRLVDDKRSQAALDFAFHGPNGAAFTVAGCRLDKSNLLVTIAREARNRDERTSCFDRLLALSDFALARSVMRLTGAPPLPATPIIADHDRSPRHSRLVAVS